MHTIHRDYDRMPFSPNYPNYYPPQYYPPIPTHDDAVQPVEEPVRVVPYRNGTLRNQEYDSPLSQDQEPDSLLDTLIVGKESSNNLDRAIEVDSTANLPSEIVSLIISLESLSQSLSISHKQFLSHQLTRLSYSLQTDCLNPEINQNWELPSKSTPSPPHITPRPSNAFPSTSKEQTPPPPPVLFTPPAISTDWSGPGSFPTFEQRSTNLDVNHQRSASVQYDPQPFMRQISQENIYANASSSSPGIKTNSQDMPAPPLPPRDHFGSQVEYQNIPTNRGSKKRIY